MASQRRTARATAAATVGLCVAAVVSSHSSLAFHLHTAGPRGGGIAEVGRCGRHAAPRRSSAAASCRPSMLKRPSSSPSREEQQLDNDGRREEGSASRREGGGAAKELSALLLSAMLLGNPQLSDAAAVTQALGGGGGGASGGPTVDPTVVQSRLIANLEKRLSSISNGIDDNADAAASETVAPPPAAAAAANPAADPAADPAARIRPMLVQPASTTPTSAAQTPSQQSPLTLETPGAVAAAATAAARTEAPAATPTKLGRGQREPLIRMRDYSFSVRLPELNLPPVAPITVPDDGRPLGAMFGTTAAAEKVGANADFPGAGVVRDTLQGAARGDGVKDLADAFAAVVPRQADYNRAVIGFEERVAKTIKAAENPAFAPGVPLAPEFASMFANAKEVAFSGVRPYLPKGVQPELALFMLVTLPVLTVALRAADENSRRPKPPPLPAGYRPPRLVRFPNSPAKVDAEAAAEARAARQAQEDIDVVKALREELAAAAAVPVAAAAVPAAAAAVPAAAVAFADLEGNVAAAVAANPDAMTAELARLRRELAAAGKLAVKVEALERANARLMGQVAELSKQPSLEEIRLRAEKESTRAAAQREREEAQARLQSEIKIKADKLSAAREAMVNLFPSRETDLSKVQQTEREPVVEKVEAVPQPVMEEEVGKEEADEVVADVEHVVLLKPEEVDPLAAARERLADAFPSRERTSMEEEYEVAAEEKPAAAAAKKKAAPAKKKAAPATKKTAPAKGKKATTEVVAAAADVEKAPTPKVAKKTKTAAGRKKKAPAAPVAPPAEATVSSAPTMLNGSSIKETGGAEERAAAVSTATPDDYDDLSEDLSRALRGVQGYDLDALDLEMEDLRPEDLEELRNLEREMGDLDLASLEAEFDQEDDESISQALRMAAESALAHTSGGGAGRRIRTASPVGARSSRSASAAGGGSPVAAAAAAAGLPQQQGARSGMGGLGGGRASVAASPTPEDELEAFRRLEMEGGTAWGPGTAAGVGAARGEKGDDDDGDWGSLSAKAVARKTVPALKEYLDEEGVDYPGKAKKAQLVDIVLDLLAEG